MPVTAYDLHQMALKRIEELEQQRDVLLAACKAQEDYDRYLAQCGDCPTLATCREVKRRRDYARALCEAAIARAKGDLRE